MKIIRKVASKKKPKKSDIHLIYWLPKKGLTNILSNFELKLPGVSKFGNYSLVGGGWKNLGADTLNELNLVYSMLEQAYLWNGVVSGKRKTFFCPRLQQGIANAVPNLLKEEAQMLPRKLGARYLQPKIVSRVNTTPLWSKTNSNSSRVKKLPPLYAGAVLGHKKNIIVKDFFKRDFLFFQSNTTRMVALSIPLMTFFCLLQVFSFSRILFLNMLYINANN